MPLPEEGEGEPMTEQVVAAAAAVVGQLAGWRHIARKRRSTCRRGVELHQFLGSSSPAPQ